MISASFLQALQKTHAGRLVGSHAVNFDYKTREGELQSAQLVAALMRRTLLVGLRGGITFGLPSPLPKFILLLNLSGDRVLIHSQTQELPALIIRSSGHPGNEERLVKFLGRLSLWVDEREDEAGLLLTYSLGWQEGVPSGFLEVRTFSKNKNGDLFDGQVLFTTNTMALANGANTSEESASFPVTLREAKALAASLTASAVVVKHDDENNINDENVPVAAELNASSVEKTLRATCAMLKEDRQKLLAELAEQRASEANRITIASAAAEARSADTISQAVTVREVAEAKVARLNTVIAAEAAQKSTLKLTVADLKRENAILELTQKSASEKFAKQQKALNAAISAANRRAGEAERKVHGLEESLKTAREDGRSSRSKDVADARTDATSAKRRAIDLEATLQKLREVLDRRDVETEAMKAQIKSLEKQVAEAEETASSEAAKAADALEREALAHSREKRRAERAEAETESLEGKLEKVRVHVKEQETLASKRDAERAEASEQYQMALAREKSLRLDIEQAEKLVALERGKALERPSAPSPEKQLTASIGVGVNFGTSTNSNACTQTDPESNEPTIECIADAARLTHRHLLRLCELAQLPGSAYDASFKGHLPPSHFWPPRPPTLNGTGGK